MKRHANGAETKLVSAHQRPRPGDPLAADKSAVLALEILHSRLAAHDRDPRVVARDPRVIQAYRDLNTGEILTKIAIAQANVGDLAAADRI